MTRNTDDMIHEIIAWFDFEKVQKTMTALDWTWGEEGTPSQFSLKESAYERLKSAAELVLSPNNTEHHEIPWISASGGFKATAWKTEKGELSRLLLEFIVTEWDAEI